MNLFVERATQEMNKRRWKSKIEYEARRAVYDAFCFAILASRFPYSHLTTSELLTMI